jgi:ligand-binding SRPBCC domain-containing protein
MRFEKQTRIAAPPGIVFAFHESPDALGRLTPPWERVRLVEGGDSLRPGARVVLSVPVGPFRMNWVAEHTEYEPGRMFADRQVEGPFASWYHRHLFLEDGHGGTLLRDEVDCEPPLGALGRLVGQAFIRAKLREMFDYRHEVTRRIVEAGDFAPPGTAGPTGEAGNSTGREREIGQHQRP